jgi:hypothetical protein
MINIFYLSIINDTGRERMRHFICRERLAMALLFVFLLGLVGMGCSSTVKRDEPPPTPAPEMAPTPAPSQPPSSPPETTIPRSVGKYYFIDDVLVPSDLEYDQSKSFVYETPQFKAGALFFTKWHLDTNSLFDFFLFHMEKDGWKMVTSYRGKESHLTFYKPDRGCTIRITESWLGKVYIEVRVGPADVRRK